MKRTKYQDGLEVDAGDLNNTESTKIEEIKYRREFVQSGAVGLLVTQGAGSTVDIGIGVGFCANGERIEVSSVVSGVSITPSQYNYITIIYREYETEPKPHEGTGVSYYTRVIDTPYAVEVLSESAYNNLSQENRDNRVLCGIYYDSTHIQTSRDLSATPTSTPLDINGVWVGKYSNNTLYGKGTFQYDWNNKRMRYAAPGDSWGNWVTFVSNWLDTDTYKLESDDTDYWVWVEVLYPILSVEDMLIEVDIRDLYKPEIVADMELGYETPTGGSEDKLHRNMLVFEDDPESGPLENNPHGVHSRDLTGYQGDITRHQDVMHCNGLISRDWFLTGVSNSLKPTCDEENKQVTIEQLGTNNYFHINGIIFDEIDETFPWTYTFSIGLWYVCLGGDRKLHVFENSYDTVNYIPIVRVSYGFSEPVLYVVYEPAPNPNVITVTVAEGGSPADEEFTILNAGAQTLRYNIVTDSGWVSCSPSSGAQRGLPADTITVSFSTDSMVIGTYSALIWITTDDPDVIASPQSVLVDLTVT